MKRVHQILLALFACAQLAGLPASAQALAGIENPGALRPFFSALARVRTSAPAGVARVVQFGDSHTVCDWLTGPLETDLQRSFGPGRGRGGVSYEVHGRNGMRAWQLLAEMRSWTPASKGLRAAQGASLIVLLYGSNEVTDEGWSPESYSRLYAEILARFRAVAPRASLLVLSPPDRAVRTSYGWQTAANLPSLLDAQRRAAFSQGAAFWNAWDAMGGAGSMNLWVSSGLAQGDHVHLTQPGYQRLAGMFFYDFVLAYNAYVAGSLLSASATPTR